MTRDPQFEPLTNSRFKKLRNSHSPVVSSTQHLAFPTVMVAFSLLKPVPVTVRRVPRPLDPETIRRSFNRCTHSVKSLFSNTLSFRSTPEDGLIPVTTGVSTSDHSKLQSPEHFEGIPLMYTSTCKQHCKPQHLRC